MKLIYAIVNNDDSHAVSSNLTKAGYSATKLASTGGFLMAGNTTFLICAEGDKVDEIVEIIKKCSRRRKQYVPASNMAGVEMQAASYPMEVSVGGATVFVTDIERFEKL
ncbi:MAG: cyclic-di-AMP receptor [Oscillospiraceae bacterium]|nr:cyclic-di-AMP receptor [Oscillospiraceae bacterium]